MGVNYQLPTSTAGHLYQLIQGFCGTLSQFGHWRT